LKDVPSLRERQTEVCRTLDPKMKTADVIIIGGGIIGCSIAWYLSREKLKVIVLDKQQPGQEASWAAAGMLSPQSDTDCPDDFFRFCLSSRDLYPQFVQRLTEESGIDVEYRTEGTIVVAFTEEESSVLEKRARWQQAEGLRIEYLAGNQVLSLTPSLSAKVQSALFVSGDHQVNNRKLTRAVTIAAARNGAEIQNGKSVLEIVVEQNRAAGVKTTGETIAGGTIVNAAGCWSGLVNAPLCPPVQPVRGQMLALDSVIDNIGYVVHTPRAYIVPRRDGRIIVGSTTERVGFDKSNTAAGVNGLLSGAIEAIPELENLPINEMWAGLRPGTPDGLPLLGPTQSSDIRNLIFATGHYRNGILLTPITAKVISEIILGEPLPEFLRAYAPDRFDDKPAAS
jgi:glycine oxidase